MSSQGSYLENVAFNRATMVLWPIKKKEKWKGDWDEELSLDPLPKTLSMEKWNLRIC